MVAQGHRIKLPDRVVALENATRVFPRDRRACFDLRPAYLRAGALADAALGDEVEDATLPVLIAGIPILHRGVLDLGILVRDQLDDRGVQLIFVAHRCRASFEITHVASLVRDDERSLELPGVRGVDPEVGRQLHRAAHTLWNVDKRAVAEDRAVECRKEIVGDRYDRAQVLLDQLGMFLHGLRERHEDDADLREPLPERRGNRYAIEHGIDRNTGQDFPLVEGNPQLFIGSEELRIDFVEALRRVLVRLRRRVVTDVLIVDLGVADLGPGRLLHFEPAPIGFESPLEKPIGLLLLVRDEGDDLFTQTGRCVLLFDVGDETGVVALLEDVVDLFGCC